MLLVRKVFEQPGFRKLLEATRWRPELMLE